MIQLENMMVAVRLTENNQNETENDQNKRKKWAPQTGKHATALVACWRRWWVGEIWQVTLLEWPGHLTALLASGWWRAVEKEGFTHRGKGGGKGLACNCLVF